MQLLLDRGMEVKPVLAKGRTLLHFGALSGDPKMLELLLKHNLDVNLADDAGVVPIHNAVYKGTLR